MAAPNDWMASVNKKKESNAQRVAAKWNMPGGGYDQFKKGDAQREKDLPIGGIARMRDNPELKPKALMSDKLKKKN